MNQSSNQSSARNVQQYILILFVFYSRDLFALIQFEILSSINAIIMDFDDEMFLDDWDDSSRDYSDTEDDYSMDSSNSPGEQLYEILSETQIEQFMKNSVEEVKCVIQVCNRI